jgi:aryl-alcohol dehydrogenase-like predicted oxidoreductase
MSFIRQLADTQLQVSALGLGSVKLGRNQGVKYPQSFIIPDDQEVRDLLALASELGINFIDTAPAYGNSEERLGKVLNNRQNWIIATKVGEEFEQGKSRFDFSAKHTRLSVERSLQRLNTDYLDIVLIHSNGKDEAILQNSDCLEQLQQLKQAGMIRAIGMSSKTIAGGILAAQLMDIVMLTYNLQQQDQAVMDFAADHNKGILVKKGLMSGHLHEDGKNLLHESMHLIFSQRAISSMIVGTIKQAHLRENVELARRIIDGL